MIPFLECDGAVTHARGCAEGGQSRREDADDDLQEGLPSFFLHSALMVLEGSTSVGKCGGSEGAPSRFATPPSFLR